MQLSGPKSPVSVSYTHLDVYKRQILVLSGVTTLDIAAQYPYRPTYILKGVGDLVKS